ncbi:LCP family protein [Phytoactinopolyspora limicola]|uniref:LCP family glycopolymer transferase n=1 Tax=Phytoactinopolyspora limicola TaxID=2715536 RepID=UPI001A9C91D6|nr:LCP family protein [Phytoactinopolyspora limicola]
MEDHRRQGDAGADAPRSGPVKVTTYSSGNVPGVSYRGGYAHSPRDEEDDHPQATPAAPAGTRAMPVDRRARASTPVPPSRPPRTKNRRDGGGRPKKRRSGFVRFLRWFLAIMLVITVGLVALVWFVWSRIEKVDAIPDDHGSARSAGQVYLVVGSDRRDDLDEEEQSELGTGSTGGERADTIMLVHVPNNGRPALISVPRDSVVDIPGHGSGRVNAAFAYGGPALLVETMEANTGVAIDDYVQLGFGGFAQIVDALGGVEMCLEEAIQDEKAKIDLPAGCQDLVGSDALGYARARYFDPRADLGRVERQRELISAIADEALSPSTLLNPIELTRTALASGNALILDEGTGPLDMFKFIRAMGRISSGSGDTLTVPLGRVGNTVDWDATAAEELWTALRDGTEVPRHLIE